MGIESIHSPRKIYSYKLSAAMLCIFIVASGVVVINNKGTFVKESKIIAQNYDVNTEAKKTMNYAPDSALSRIMTEEAINMDKSATVDIIAPKNKNINDRYASSQNVIKGSVYSTEYFWHNSDN